MNERNVYSNEAHLLLLIVVIRTIIKIEDLFFYTIIIFTYSVSAELMSMSCQLPHNVCTIVISNSNAYYY